jgi:hypothetical protein
MRCCQIDLLAACDVDQTGKQAFVPAARRVQNTQGKLAQKHDQKALHGSFPHFSPVFDGLAPFSPSYSMNRGIQFFVRLDLFSHALSFEAAIYSPKNDLFPLSQKFVNEN